MLLSNSHRYKCLIKTRQEAQLDRNGVDRDKLQKMQEYMEDLRERSKRTIMRKLMKG